MLSKMCSTSTEQEDVNFSNDTFNPAKIIATHQVNNFKSQPSPEMTSPIDFKVNLLQMISYKVKHKIKGIYEILTQNDISNC